MKNETAIASAMASATEVFPLPGGPTSNTRWRGSRLCERSRPARCCSSTSSRQARSQTSDGARSSRRLRGRGFHHVIPNPCGRLRGRGVGHPASAAVASQRARQPVCEDIVLLDTLLGDDRLHRRGHLLAVSRRAGPDQRDEKVATCHGVLSGARVRRA